MVTLDDVAAKARVSRMTASNALRGKSVVKPETAKRVLKAAAELGYQPNLAARQLSSGRTHIIGLSVVDFDLIFPAALTAALSDQAYRRGYQTIAQQTRSSTDYERAMMGSASAQICDGTILCWPSSDSAQVLQFAGSHPLVAFDGFGLERRVDCVFTPCVTGAKAAMEHLLAQPVVAPAGTVPSREAAHSLERDQSRHRVLVLGTPYCPVDELMTASGSGPMRLRGAYEALAEHDLPYQEQDIYLCGWNRKSGYEAMACILRERRDFDTVFCLTDPIAIGALKALTDAGVRVPEDVAIMGFDGVEDGQYTNPGLSSVMVDVNEVATTCLDLLVSRIESAGAASRGGAAADGSLPARSVTVGYHIEPRGSAEREVCVRANEI
ncbi:MAG: LacI family DNA-binding transcriptional regulator [Bifidobacterium scardovii]|uniref:LacI family DNA-binding transcriptional regulator n=1 Tax=Bifidobacterium scardovii TaxID=158787 RepID=UPI0006694384|nr:LacI family DNA-binding transcriptional regulator [Bifidobacterium scardovii]MBS6947362.1 LacI family DNA-binding transcriptional regulator [Bifidobacterium scardovii]MDU3736425.1 LacI family DNA-binding transcriptional regulator [Bifidobacterium scardovii]MDU5297055.1 LacI family DNA-binding transcriptional regulator [Bifidobacterium scardovii]MDU5611338.1 LacI family DNA-binding transcriptional regulator [Bifidobacterium scardovii]MDU5886107.1 LacI family DNA-binding transcriptional regul